MNEPLTPDDRASAEGLLSDAHWAIETLRRNERTEPDSPFWQGWDAALAAIAVALRSSESNSGFARPIGDEDLTKPHPIRYESDSGIDVERLRRAVFNIDHATPGVGWVEDVVAEYARLSTPRTETSDGLLDAERDALL